MCSSPDVLGLFSNNLVPFSGNVVLTGPLFSINVVREWAMFLGQAIYVLGPLQLARAKNIFLHQSGGPLSEQGWYGE